MTDTSTDVIEPSDLERSEWPDTTRLYVEWIEDCHTDKAMAWDMLAKKNDRIAALSAERDALRKQIAEGQAERVVKPLEWVDVYRNGTRFEPCCYGLPAISMAGDGTWYWNGGNYPSVEAAMETAQPLHEKAILSAIEPAQTPAMRCAECDCEHGGADCNWIGASPAQARREALEELLHALPDQIGIYRLIKASGERKHGKIAKIIADELGRIRAPAEKEQG